MSVSIEYELMVLSLDTLFTLFIDGIYLLIFIAEPVHFAKIEVNRLKYIGSNGDRIFEFGLL